MLSVSFLLPRQPKPSGIRGALSCSPPPRPMHYILFFPHPFYSKMLFFSVPTSHQQPKQQSRQTSSLAHCLSQLHVLPLSPWMQNPGTFPGFTCGDTSLCIQLLCTCDDTLPFPRSRIMIAINWNMQTKTSDYYEMFIDLQIMYFIHPVSYLSDFRFKHLQLTATNLSSFFAMRNTPVLSGPEKVSMICCLLILRNN